MSDSHRVTLSSDGRIVIPAELRRSLELEPGDSLEVEVREGRLVITPGDRSDLERRIWTDDEHLDLPAWLRSA